MTGYDIIKFVVSCGIVVVIIGVGYFGYRYFETPRLINLGAVASMQGLAKLPPTQCRVATAGFDSSYQGVVYIDQGQLRADIMYEEGQQGAQPTLIHTLVATSGVAYRWDEGATKGIELPFDFTANALSMTCAPWLKPDLTLFELPLGVAFTQQAASAQ